MLLSQMETQIVTIAVSVFGSIMVLMIIIMIYCIYKRQKKLKKAALRRALAIQEKQE